MRADRLDSPEDPSATARDGKPDEKQDEKETGRVDAFSDGVFAIAVTLLVLTIQVPDPTTLKTHTLAAALLAKWPVYLAYVISFSFILIMWINHHNMFRSIARADHWLLLLNGLLLLFITLVPFPTALLAEYLDIPDRANQTTAAVVYSGLFVLIALAFNVMWWYIVRHPRLLLAHINTRLTSSITRRYRFGPILYLIALALAFVNVFASVALNVALAVFFALPHRLDDPGEKPAIK